MLRLRGSRRAEGRADEPVAPSEPPACPDFLDAYARAAWDDLVPKLQTLGVLSSVDGQALALLCQTWSRWRKATEFINEHGETYPVFDGRGTANDGRGNFKYFKKYPHVAIAESTGRMLAQSLAEFGLTPSARTRISVTPSGKDDNGDKGRFFTGAA